LHALSVAVVLPVAVQKPAAHVPAHEACPAAAYVPAAHAVGALAPAAQKKPAGHCTCVCDAAATGQ